MELIEENAEVLRSLGHDPAGPATPRLIDFTLVLPSEAARAQAVSLISGLGYRCKASAEAVNADKSEAVATKTLEPTAAAITEAELALNDCLAAVGGRTNGWGFWNETTH